MVKPYCEYNCDYPCSICLREAREAQAKDAQRNVNYPVFEDPDLEDALPWSGYVSGGDRPVHLPIPRFTPTGDVIPPASPAPAQEFAPTFDVLEFRAIVEAEAQTITGLDKLKDNQIILG